MQVGPFEATWLSASFITLPILQLDTLILCRGYSMSQQGIIFMWRMVSISYTNYSAIGICHFGQRTGTCTYLHYRQMYSRRYRHEYIECRKVLTLILQTLMVIFVYLRNSVPVMVRLINTTFIIIIIRLDWYSIHPTSKQMLCLTWTPTRNVKVWRQLSTRLNGPKGEPGPVMRWGWQHGGWFQRPGKGSIITSLWWQTGSLMIGLL
jgi:hypothetical protein